MWVHGKGRKHEKLHVSSVCPWFQETSGMSLINQRANVKGRPSASVA